MRLKPTMREHLSELLFVRPFDFLVALACILTGLRILLDPDSVPSSIGDLPDVVTVTYRLILLAAGTLFMAGILKRRQSAMERSGLWLAATAFTAYALAATLAGITPQATLAIMLTLAIGIACGLRAVGIARESKARLQALQEAPRKATGNE